MGVKIDRHGQAKILTTEEIQLLFSQGFTTPRNRALFAIMLYTACRVNEAVTLRAVDIYDTKGRVRQELMIRKANTKGKLATRTIPVVQDLQKFLVAYQPPTRRGFLFPGQNGRPHLHPDSAAWLLRQACKRVDIEGVSTHSFRRTALSHLSNAGIPLRVIQEVSGHRTLDELYKYLEVNPEQVRGAVAALSMLTPVEESTFGKPFLTEADQTQESPTVLPDGTN
jgi:integrase/recombinase XerD